MTDVIDRRGIEAQVLVCTKCHFKSSGNNVGEAVKKEATKWAEQQNSPKTTYTATTSCLGACSRNGAGVVIQPHNKWYANVLPDDVPELLSEVVGNDNNPNHD